MALRTDVSLPDRPLRRGLWGAWQGLFFGGLLYLTAVLGISSPLSWEGAWPFLLVGLVVCAGGHILARGALGGCLGLLAGALLGSSVAEETSLRPQLARYHLNRQARLSGITLAGTRYDVADRSGKVVLIAFWKPAHLGCRRQMSHLKGLYEKYRGDGLAVVAVSVGGSRQEVADLVRKEELPWPQVVPEDGDAGAWENPTLFGYLSRSVPYVVVVDRKGKNVAAGLTGLRLEQAVSEVLADKAPSAPTGSGFEEPWALACAGFGCVGGMVIERRLRRAPRRGPVHEPA